MNPNNDLEKDELAQDKNQADFAFHQISPQDLLDESFAEKMELEIPAKGMKITVHSYKPLDKFVPKVVRREIVYDLPPSFNENNNVFKIAKYPTSVQVVWLEMLERIGFIAKFSTEAKAKLLNWVCGTGSRSAEKMFTDIRYHIEHFNNKPSIEVLERVNGIIAEIIEEIDKDQEDEKAIVYDRIYEKISKIFVLLSYRKDNLDDLKKAMLLVKKEISVEIERVKTKYNL